MINQKLKTERMPATFIARKPIKQRLMDDSSIDENTGCWNWNKSLLNKRYGQTSIKGKNYQAHRVSWEVFNESKIPPNKQINHKCHNSICINPEHLYLGTQKENIRDMDLANRRSIRAGTKCNMAKLSEELVNVIRELLDKGARSCDLANEFGVGRSCIAHIKHKRNWKHVK